MSASLENELRFEFGENWKSFLAHLNESRIVEAENSLKSIFQIQNLEGLTFLDIGSGSGLFSLAAVRLGAKVHSLDFDKNSVACAQYLKDNYYPESEQWTIEAGSVLDGSYIRSLGKYDLVYSWGVLHHTGDMKLALENAGVAVANNGKLAIAIYNDQGYISNAWKNIKRFYCSGPTRQALVNIIWLPYFVIRDFIGNGLNLRRLLQYYKNYKTDRGMSRFHDIKDWLGGYPFEVAKPEEIIEFYNDKSFSLAKLKTCGGGLGCNEFLFVRNNP